MKRSTSTSLCLYFCVKLIRTLLQNLLFELTPNKLKNYVFCFSADNEMLNFDPGEEMRGLTGVSGSTLHVHPTSRRVSSLPRHMQGCVGGRWERSDRCPLSPSVSHKLHHGRKTLRNHSAIVYDRRVTTATVLRGWAEEAELLEEGRARRITVGGCKQRALLRGIVMTSTWAFWRVLASNNWTPWSNYVRQSPPQTFLILCLPKTGHCMPELNRHNTC